MALSLSAVAALLSAAAPADRQGAVLGNNAALIVLGEIVGVTGGSLLAGIDPAVPIVVLACRGGAGPPRPRRPSHSASRGGHGRLTGWSGRKLWRRSAVQTTARRSRSSSPSVDQLALTHPPPLGQGDHHLHSGPLGGRAPHPPVGRPRPSRTPRRTPPSGAAAAAGASDPAPVPVAAVPERGQVVQRVRDVGAPGAHRGVLPVDQPDQPALPPDEVPGAQVAVADQLARPVPTWPSNQAGVLGPPARDASW